MAMVVRNGAVDEFTYSSVDLQGKPVHKSKRGGWTACFFVVGNKLLHLSLSLPSSTPLYCFILAHHFYYQLALLTFF